MSLVVCPYTGLALPDSVMSWEHPIPEAIGGGDSLRIRVERSANSRFGSEVDAPFVASSAILWHRAQGVPGKSGEVPWYEEQTEIQVGGRAVLVPTRWRKVGEKFELDTPHVTAKFPEQDGSSTYHVVGLADCAGGELVLAQIYARLEERAARRGRKIAVASRSRENCEIELPSQCQLEISHGAVWRFMAKAALGVSSWHFGERWGTTSYARDLRRVATAELSLGQATALDGEIQPLGPMIANGSLPMLSPFRANFEEEHEIGFVPYHDGVRIHIFIFGTFAARFIVNAPGSSRLPVGWGLRFRERGRLRPLAADAAFCGAGRVHSTR